MRPEIDHLNKFISNIQLHEDEVPDTLPIGSSKIEESKTNKEKKQPRKTKLEREPELIQGDEREFKQKLIFPPKSNRKIPKISEGNKRIQQKKVICSVLCPWCQEEIIPNGINENYVLNCGHKFHINCLKTIMEMVEVEGNATCVAPDCTHFLNIKEKQDIKSILVELKNIGNCGICKKRISEEEIQFIKLKCQHLIHNSCLKDNYQRIYKHCEICSSYLSQDDRELIKSIQRSKYHAKRDKFEAKQALREEMCKICNHMLSDRPFLMLSCSHYFHNQCLQKKPFKDNKCPYCNNYLKPKDTELINSIISKNIKIKMEDINNNPNNYMNICVQCRKPAKYQKEFIELGCRHRIHIQCVRNAEKLFILCPIIACYHVITLQMTEKLKRIRGDIGIISPFNSSQEIHNKHPKVVTNAEAVEPPPKPSVIDNLYERSGAICGCCNKQIFSGELELKLSTCSHLFHLKCIQKNFELYSREYKTNRLPKLHCPNKCGNLIIEEELHIIFNKVESLPNKQPSPLEETKDIKHQYKIHICQLCEGTIENTKELSFLQCGHKYHKNCLLKYLGEKTNGRLLLTKIEENQYPRQCPVKSCHEILSNSIIMKYILDSAAITLLTEEMKNREKEEESHERSLKRSKGND